MEKKLLTIPDHLILMGTVCIIFYYIYANLHGNPAFLLACKKVTICLSHSRQPMYLCYPFFFFNYYFDTLTVYRIKIYLSKHNSVGQAYYLAQAKLRKGTLNAIKQISYI
jgi:hypothetical protein